MSVQDFEESQSCLQIALAPLVNVMCGGSEPGGSLTLKTGSTSTRMMANSAPV